MVENTLCERSESWVQLPQESIMAVGKASKFAPDHRQSLPVNQTPNSMTPYRDY